MKNSIKEKMSGWGGYPVENVNSIYPNDVGEILREIKKGNVIARGNGRSYGDSAQNIEKTINMRGFNKMLSFDNNHFFEINLLLASLESFDDFIIFIISSILEFATTKPSNICALSLALFSSNIVLLVITSSLNIKKAFIISFKFNCSGLPLFKANIFELKVVCVKVCLYN